MFLARWITANRKEFRYECVSRLTCLSLEIGDLAERKTIGDNIVEDDKTVIHRCAFGWRDERCFGRRPRSALGSTARGRPCWMSSLIVLRE
jgi:hypothetical protein